MLSMMKFLDFLFSLSTGTDTLLFRIQKKKKKKRKKVCHGNFEERIATLKLTPTFQSTNSPCIQDLGLKAESKV